nr:MAG TPA: hypothetical protein [Caudoviricetes sp.]
MFGLFSFILEEARRCGHEQQRAIDRVRIHRGNGSGYLPTV